MATYKEISRDEAVALHLCGATVWWTYGRARLLREEWEEIPRKADSGSIQFRKGEMRDYYRVEVDE